MELEELKVAWRELERRLDARDELDQRLLKQAKLDKTRSALRGIGWGQALQALIFIGVISVAAPFWIENRHVTHLLVFGLALHLYAVAAAALSAMQLLAIASIRYDDPIVVLQERLARFRRLRLRNTLILSLPWPMLWIVVTVIGAKRLLGIDLYAQSPGWINVTLVIGAAIIALWLALRRWLERTSRGASFLSSFAGDCAGASLQQAARHLDEIARFTKE